MKPRNPNRPSGPRPPKRAAASFNKNRSGPRRDAPSGEERAQSPSGIKTRFDHKRDRPGPASGARSSDALRKPRDETATAERKTGFEGREEKGALRRIEEREFAKKPREERVYSQRDRASARVSDRASDRAAAPSPGGDSRKHGRRPDDRGKGKARPHQDNRPHGERPARSEKPRREGDAWKKREGALWIYGKHAALAALANPERIIKRIFASESALEWIAEQRFDQSRLARLAKADNREIDGMLHDGAVHQGIAVEVEELTRARLRETCEPDGTMRPVVVLDQITDPHNIGAIFRSAAAFGARAVIVQDRRTPPLAGALAKAAAGAVEMVPCIEVVNVARALDALKSLGYFCAGLAGEADTGLDALPSGRPVAIVLGSEGDGLRQLVATTCDALYRIPVDRRIDSLNVSNAAAIALYEASRATRNR